MVTAYGAAQYRQMDVEGASPIRLVIMAYDLAIRSCEKKDFETSIKAVMALQNSLDFDFPEAAGRLLAVYQWVAECLRKTDFDAARNILIELREAWSAIEKKLNSSKVVQVTETGGLLYDEEIVKK
jgi:flagellin-specific chaperone FliS